MNDIRQSLNDGRHLELVIDIEAHARSPKLGRLRILVHHNLCAQTRQTKRGRYLLSIRHSRVLLQCALCDVFVTRCICHHSIVGQCNAHLQRTCTVGSTQRPGQRAIGFARLGIVGGSLGKISNGVIGENQVGFGHPDILKECLKERRHLFIVLDGTRAPIEIRISLVCLGLKLRFSTIGLVLENGRIVLGGGIDGLKPHAAVIRIR